jgi:16S rRNA (guanine527-N7)-methyltransferase
MTSAEDLVAPEKEIMDLVDKVRRSGIDVRPGAGDLLARLAGLVVRWNRKVNLVSRKDIARLVSYHFCDSASVLPVLRPGRDVKALDIGGSNGLPGLVLAALSPHLKVTVCDSKVRRRDFMEEACRELGVGARFEQGRIDDKKFRTSYDRFFDLIVARAVTTLRTLYKWCMPLLAPGGRIVAYKGSRCLEEVKQAQSRLLRGGGDRLVVVGSPWSAECNPLRMFAIAGKGRG